MNETYELIIVGGGPAGAAAAIYAARKRIRTLFITNEWGGQSNVSTEIHNWVGTPKISGADLAKSLKAHVETYQGDTLTVLSPATAQSLVLDADSVHVTIARPGAPETTATGKTLLVATGAKRRTLDVPGAKEYDQKGLTYCASCDGPMYAEQDVAVIGGGNAAFETALQLLAYCKTVSLLNRSDLFRADEITVAAAAAHANMNIIKNAEPVRVVGEQFVNGLVYRDTQSGKETQLSVAGIFVEVGLIPNTSWTGDVLEKNAVGQIKVEPRTMRSSHPRVWAAGDCTDGLYHQNNIAVGDAIKALEDIYLALRRK